MANVVENHLKYWCKDPPSECGIRVAELLDIWDGLHHFDSTMMAKVEWTNPYFIKLRLDRSLSSFDFDALTRLVFLAHDRCIRVEIKPCNPRFLMLLFHPRATCEGTITERHPTLEESVERWRSAHPIAAAEPAAA